MTLDAGVVELSAVPNLSQFGSLLSSGVSKELGPVESLLKNNLGKVAALGIGAALVEFGKVSVEAFQEREDVLIKFENTLKSMPALAHANEQAFLDQAHALQELTGVEDETVVSADEVLGRFGLTQDQIQQLIPLVLDYAAKTGGDVVTSASNLGRALLGNARALKAIGVNFKATGDRTKDFNTIVEQLQTHVGGIAKEFGDTLPGQINILKANVNDMEEEFGAVLVPLLLSLAHILATVLGPALEFAAEHAKGLTQVIIGFVAFKAAIAVINLIGVALTALAGYTGLAAGALLDFGAALAAALPELAAAAAAGYLLGKALAVSSDEFVRGTEEIESNAQTIANAGVYLDKGRDSAENFAIAMDQLGQTAERTGSTLEPRTAEFEALTNAFSTGSIGAKEYGIGLKRLGFNAHQVAGFIDLARQQSQDLTVALDDAHPSMLKLAHAAGDLSDDAKKAAAATFKLWQAELQLAGGVEGVITSQRAAGDADEALAKARGKLAALEKKGITSGKKYKEAQDAVTSATDAAYQAHLDLVSSVEEELSTESQTAHGHAQAIHDYITLAKEAGLTAKEIKAGLKVFQQEGDYVSNELGPKLDSLPKHLKTTWTFDVSGESKKLLDRIGGFNLSPGAGSGFGSEVPRHAAGGWVMKPEIAAIAEKEPELIVPKSKLEDVVGAGGDHHVHVTVGVDTRTGNLRAYVDERIGAERAFTERRGRTDR